MRKDNFYKILELLYSNMQVIDAENNETLELVNALHVYQMIEEIIPRILRGYDLRQGMVIDDNNKVQITRLIIALKKVKTFPRPQLKDINREAFSELGHFLEFVESIQGKRTIKRKYSDIVLVDESSGRWTLSQEDHAEMFLREYLDNRYKNQSEQSPSDQEQDAITQLWGTYQNDVLIKLALDIKADIALQLKKAGMLSLVATKITIRKNDQQSLPLEELLADKVNLLNVLSSNENIIRIFYKPFLKTEEMLAYYAVFVVKSVFFLNENVLISNIRTVLGEQITKTFGISADINVQNLNPVISKNFMSTSQMGNFLLVEGVEESWEFIDQVLFGFLYQLERLGIFTLRGSTGDTLYAVITHKLRDIQLKAGTCIIEPELTYFQANHIQEQIPHLLFFAKGQRSKYIWDTMHLSDFAREYVARIAVLYQENFAVWKTQEYLELAICIEIFMMTLMESALDAFYSFTADVRDILNRNIENCISRQLLQFAEIFRNQYQLDVMQHQLEGKMISHTLKYFFHIYARQLRDQGDAAVLKRILAADLHERCIQKKLDELLFQFRFTQPLFFKAEPRPKAQKILGEKMRIRLYAQIVQPSSTQSTFSPTPNSQNSISSVQAAIQHYVDNRIPQPLEHTTDTSHKLIHIQRHKSRLEKVQGMLKYAMKTDVVIIRCLFYCDTNKIIDYSYFSKIFSTMLQDNKKRKPISDMAAYLGYWEGHTRTSKNKITNYAANVVLMFKSQALLEYPDLFAELERSWCSACRKIERDCDPEIRIKGNVEKLQIAQTLPQLRCHQFLLETTQKTLARNIVNYLASYVVYQDLLDDEIYQQLPKWLIKKTGTANKPKAARSAIKKT